MQFISLAILGKRIKSIMAMMQDKSVPRRKKAVIVFGIIYLVLPVDLIPPIIPVFGLLDDIILWLFILDYLKDELDKYWMKENPPEKTESPEKKFRGKNIVDGVEFEVREDGADSPKEEQPEDSKKEE